jgi:hypothetical protein
MKFLSQLLDSYFSRQWLLLLVTVGIVIAAGGAHIIGGYFARLFGLGDKAASFLLGGSFLLFLVALGLAYKRYRRWRVFRQ